MGGIEVCRKRPSVTFGRLQRGFFTTH